MKAIFLFEEQRVYKSEEEASVQAMAVVRGLRFPGGWLSFAIENTHRVFILFLLLH